MGGGTKALDEYGGLITLKTAAEPLPHYLGVVVSWGNALGRSRGEKVDIAVEPYRVKSQACS